MKLPEILQLFMYCKTKWPTVQDMHFESHIHFYFTDWCAITYDLDSLGVYLDTQTIKLSNAETE